MGRPTRRGDNWTSSVAVQSRLGCDPCIHASKHLFRRNECDPSFIYIRNAPHDLGLPLRAQHGRGFNAGPKYLCEGCALFLGQTHSLGRQLFQRRWHAFAPLRVIRE